MLVLLVFLSQFMLTIPMELGKGGVYDSPLATDELVREFGFLFGGGRSGVKGIEAFQVSLFRTAITSWHIFIGISCFLNLIL